MDTKLPSQEELNSIWRGLNPDLPDFRFEWSAKRTRTAGTIYYIERVIVLSVKHYLEFGKSIITDTLKHEAAHYLAWIKHQTTGHNQWFWYYLGVLGANRHCLVVSSDMKAKRVRVKHYRPKRHIEYDPVLKQFRQFYE